MKLGFPNDAGATFSKPTRICAGNSFGHVSVAPDEAAGRSFHGWTKTPTAPPPDSCFARYQCRRYPSCHAGLPGFKTELGLPPTRSCWQGGTLGEFRDCAIDTARLTTQ